MIKNHRTKILSWPQEEVLEVSTHGPDLHQIVGLERVEFKGRVSNFFYGSIVDYDGVEYDFEWDTQEQKLSRLVGSQVNGLLWGQASLLVRESFMQEEEKATPLEDKIEEKIEQVVGQSASALVETFTESFKELNDKIENFQKPSMVTVVETPREVFTPVAELKPQPIPEVSIEYIDQEEFELPILKDEDDFSTNALQFLQESSGADLQIDYLSL